MPIDKSIDYSRVTPKLRTLSKRCVRNDTIDPKLYERYHVNRGLRDLNGNGVLTGLTEISDIVAFKNVNGKKVPCDGKLYYRGVDVEQIGGVLHVDWDDQDVVHMTGPSHIVFDGVFYL